jgi:hypothetical protein
MSDELLGMVPPNTTGTYQQVAQLFAALAEAQGAFTVIQRNREVVIRPRESTAYTFTYADLGEIRSAITAALKANGLGWHSATVGDWLRTSLTHAAGATLFTECAAPKMQGDPKAYGAQVTYLRRYHISMLLGIAADDDIEGDGDGSGADAQFGDSAAGNITQGASGPPPMQRKAAAAPGAKIDAGSVAWINRKIKALGMDAAMIEAMFTRLQIPLKAPADLTAEEFAVVKTELTKASAL